jgi:beta-lactam-binding protein with PASTA domain
VDEARQRLGRAGFEVLALEQEGNAARAGEVLSQTPSGGATVPRGSLVILYVGA